MTMPSQPPQRAAAPALGPRLGGALAVIFWCACGITALPLAGLFSLVAGLGVAGAKSALFDSFAGAGVGQQVLRLGLVPQLVLFAWAASLVVLTVAKSSLARSVSPWILVAWVLASAYSQFAIRDAISPDGADLGAFAALMPGLLLQAASAAAFFGYFREGARPLAYYRR
ncbi:hypothetical protein EZH22_20595 [Xanthobacter dioxanivorans]|uniref:DUF2569 domain-containing protein n=1 Tax=Xanthobacter dioxanivorans TaxID=2528964 RepID=A0A974PLM9_9HYPH|nr:hypothetical protein [Xanthobacter dioxanivorans]QRG05461.1 hypothetical protein EZH22_20595 [Xanthobacter dioxanivorans]